MRCGCASQRDGGHHAIAVLFHDEGGALCDEVCDGGVPFLTKDGGVCLVRGDAGEV